MSYTPTTWKDGDLVTSAKLNKLENGVAAASGPSILIANMDMDAGSLDKTWQEIYNADICYIMSDFGMPLNKSIIPVSQIGRQNNNYAVGAILPGSQDYMMFFASTPNDYPSMQIDNSGSETAS